jgi:GNAT superfamily N-acetyltransferase
MTDPDGIFPLTPARWADFEQLFGPRGACGGCWCMYWKRGRKDYEAAKGEGNRLAQKALVDSGVVPGLIAYMDGVPAGWVAVEPRKNFPVLGNSRILAPLDDLAVWSVPCFFVARKYRNAGLSVALLRAAVERVAQQGGMVVEGYPVEPAAGTVSVPAFIYTGLASTFRQAGFVEAGRRSEKRPIMRYAIDEK